MKIFLFLLSLLVAFSASAEPPQLPLPWVKLSEIYYTPTQVRMYGGNLGDNACQQGCNAVYMLRGLIDNYGPQIPDIPITVDLAPYGVASDAKVAWLTGILIITHGTTNEIADLHLTFAPDDNTIDCSRYIGQVTEAYIQGGQRSPISIMVPLINGKFQFCYHVATQGTWPTNSSYGINLSLQAWGR